jgi:hypothetical protein
MNTYSAEIRKEADLKIKLAMAGFEVEFCSDNDSRVFSLDIAYKALCEEIKFTDKLVLMGLEGKRTDGYIRLEALKWLTKKIYEAECDWEFERQHP